MGLYRPTQNARQENMQHLSATNRQMPEDFLQNESAVVEVGRLSAGRDDLRIRQCG